MTEQERYEICADIARAIKKARIEEAARLVLEVAKHATDAAFAKCATIAKADAMTGDDCEAYDVAMRIAACIEKTAREETR